MQAEGAHQSPCVWDRAGNNNNDGIPQTSEPNSTPEHAQAHVQHTRHSPRCVLTWTTATLCIESRPASRAGPRLTWRGASTAVALTRRRARRALSGLAQPTHLADCFEQVRVQTGAGGRSCGAGGSCRRTRLRSHRGRVGLSHTPSAWALLLSSAQLQLVPALIWCLGSVIPYPKDEQRIDCGRLGHLT